MSSCTITNGQVTGSFKVTNPAALGAHIIKVTGTPVLDSAQAVFTVTNPTPTITLSVSSGPVSTVVSVTGSGFVTTDATCAISSSPAPDITIGPPVSSCTITNGQVTGSFKVIPAARTWHIYDQGNWYSWQ